MSAKAKWKTVASIGLIVGMTCAGIASCQICSSCAVARFRASRRAFLNALR